MAKNRHDRVIEILYKIVKRDKSYGKVYADHIVKDYKSINVLSRNKRSAAEVYPYYPDLWCEYRSKKKIDVIEVWDSQSEEASAEDIILSVINPEVASLSIICFDEQQYKLANKLKKVILSNIFNEKGEQLLDSVYVGITLIPKEILNNDNKLKAFLIKKLNYSG